MTNLEERLSSWLAANDDPENPATPAATVLVLRDGDAGLETLMLRRNAKGAFADHWVFPGGKVDPEDYDDTDGLVSASRRAASREANEEADLVIDADSMVPFSHWMPPSIVPRRFATWFFATAAPVGVDGDVMIDGGEIVDHLWLRPTDVLARHRAGEIELVPPTWITLRHLAQHDSTAAALVACAAREPFFYVTKRLKADPPVLVWHGDAAYESGDLSAEGGRHRLVMSAGDWEFEEPE